MENTRKKLTRVQINFIVAASMLLTALILFGLKFIPWFSEHFFARGVSRTWVFVFGHISSVFPFSLFEVFVVACVAYGLYCITVWIIAAVKKDGGRFKRSLSVLCVVVTSILMFYSLAASPAYYRSDISAAVPFYEGEILTQEEVREMAEWYFNEINTLAAKFDRDDEGRIITPYTHRELSEKIAEEFARLGGGYLSPYTPAVKPSFLKFMWKDFGVAGVTFVPFGEALVLDDMPAVYLVQTMAHEAAHTKGVMRENDANLVAQYLLFSAEDDFLRYCGFALHFYYIDDFLESYPALKELSGELWASLHPGVFTDLRAVFAYWAFDSIFDKIASWFNNIYLKMSGSSGGTSSYHEHGGEVEYVPIDPPPGTPPVPGGIVYIPKYISYSTVEKMLISVYQNKK